MTSPSKEITAIVPSGYLRCPICRDPLNDGESRDNVVAAPCHHLYHLHCILSKIEEKNQVRHCPTCPLCGCSIRGKSSLSTFDFSFYEDDGTRSQTAQEEVKAKFRLRQDAKRYRTVPVEDAGMSCDVMMLRSGKVVQKPPQNLKIDKEGDNGTSTTTTPPIITPAKTSDGTSSPAPQPVASSPPVGNPAPDSVDELPGPPPSPASSAGGKVTTAAPPPSPASSAGSKVITAAPPPSPASSAGSKVITAAPLPSRASSSTPPSPGDDVLIIDISDEDLF